MVELLVAENCNWQLATGFKLLRLNIATFYMVVFVVIVIVVERAANYWFQSIVFSNP